MNAPENSIVDLYLSILFRQPLAHNRIVIYIQNMALYIGTVAGRWVLYHLTGCSIII